MERTEGNGFCRYRIRLATRTVARPALCVSVWHNLRASNALRRRGEAGTHGEAPGKLGRYGESPNRFCRMERIVAWIELEIAGAKCHK
jgi:hypothetical protein